jgi:hypothetical protein
MGHELEIYVERRIGVYCSLVSSIWTNHQLLFAFDHSLGSIKINKRISTLYNRLSSFPCQKNYHTSQTFQNLPITVAQFMRTIQMVVLTET